MVIHQEKNTPTEQVAQAFARQQYERDGYRIVKGKRGCDFIARKGDQVIPVEVKGRSTLMNFTNMSRHQFETLQNVPNARVIFVYVELKDTPRVITHLTLTKDDVARYAISSYRVIWKGSLRDRIMEDLRRRVKQTRELVNQTKGDKNPVGTGS